MISSSLPQQPDKVMEPAENQEQVLSDPQPAIPQDKPLSKTETIKLLNDSIDRLEQTIKGIKEEQAPVPSTGSINTLLNTTQELAEGVSTVQEARPTPNSVETASASPAQTESKAQAPTKATSSSQRNVILIVIGVTVIAIAAVLALWLWSPFSPEPLATLPEIIAVETGSSITAESPIDEPAINETLEETSTQKRPVLGDVPNTQDEPIAETTTLEDPAPVVLPDLSAPGRSENLKMVTIKPELTFTPEQSLIAGLRNKLSKLGANYPDNLIDSVSVDLPQKSLLVKVSNDWYGLSQSRQNKVGNDLLKLSRRLSFAKLVLEDNTESLVARNPVIGEEIILVKTVR